MILAQKQKYRPMKQDRKPINKPCTYGYLIFDKGGKNIQWGGYMGVGERKKSVTINETA